jgi:SWI/SNF-related matrix-associated actin-dependent regulator of chromatin subfamily A-like protein 1
MQAYHLTGECKLDGIKEFMGNLIENNCKFIVFAHHLSVMNGIEDYAKKEKLGYICIDGSVNADVRHERVWAF